MFDLKRIIATVVGLAAGASAFTGCYLGSCEQETIPTWTLSSGTYESESASGGAEELPHLQGADLKTMELDLANDRLTVRYFDADERRVEEVWAIGERTQTDTFY